MGRHLLIMLSRAGEAHSEAGDACGLRQTPGKPSSSSVLDPSFDTVMSAKSKATALLRGAQSMVAVNRKTGVIAAMAPRIQFEAPKPLEMPKSYSKTGMSLQDSVYAALRMPSRAATCN